MVHISFVFVAVITFFTTVNYFWNTSPKKKKNNIKKIIKISKHNHVQKSNQNLENNTIQKNEKVFNQKEILNNYVLQHLRKQKLKQEQQSSIDKNWVKI